MTGQVAQLVVTLPPVSKVVGYIHGSYINFWIAKALIMI